MAAADEGAIEAFGKEHYSHSERAEVQQPGPRMAPATAGYFPPGDLHFPGPIGFVFQGEMVEVVKSRRPDAAGSVWEINRERLHFDPHPARVVTAIGAQARAREEKRARFLQRHRVGIGIGGRFQHSAGTELWPPSGRPYLRL